MAEKHSLFPQKAYFRCGKVQTSREIIKHYFLLNIYLISNLGKFRAMQLWIWPSKLSFRAVILIKSEFQNRFWIIFDFILSFFQSLCKRWVNNKLKLDESSLLHIFYYILYFTVILSLAKRFEMMVTAAFRKNHLDVFSLTVNHNDSIYTKIIIKNFLLFFFTTCKNEWKEYKF